MKESKTNSFAVHHFWRKVNILCDFILKKILGHGPPKFGKKYFFGHYYHVKFGNFVNFSGKYRVKFIHISGAKMPCLPKVDWGGAPRDICLVVVVIMVYHCALTDGTKSIDCEFEENGALPACGYKTAPNSKLNWTLRSHGEISMSRRPPV